MIISYGDSRAGLVRKINEDCISQGCSPFFVLADGMGGYAGGETASRIAVDSAKDFFRDYSLNDISEDIMRESVLIANDKILNKKANNENLAPMGTTMISVCVVDDTLYWAHVGDSRLYLFYENTLTQITTDHSFVMELLASGSISPEEARVHPRKNEITRAVGIEEDLKVDTGHLHLKSPALLLLCSDGLTGMIEDESVREILSEYVPSSESALKDAAEKLFEAAYAAGGRDNVSVILIDYNKDKKL